MYPDGQKLFGLQPVCFLNYLSDVGLNLSIRYITVIGVKNLYEAFSDTGFNSRNPVRNKLELMSKRAKEGIVAKDSAFVFLLFYVGQVLPHPI